MKKSALFLFLILAPLKIAIADTAGRFDFGVMVMFGGRYDNMRMCVASDSGAKGGPVADIMLTVRYGVNDNLSLGADIPVMRPILFAAAFRMLQFEPQFVVEWRIAHENADLIIAPALGASFHYGPDYLSNRKNPNPSFFAAGPIIGLRLGVGFGEQQRDNTIALRPFYAPLFSKDYGTGTVLGGALEYLRTF